MITFHRAVSVIIPTHNRVELLSRTIDALTRQTYPAAQTEVVVVADGCTDSTVEKLRNFTVPFHLRLLEQDGLGAALARNYGAKQALGSLLIFLDDDVVPSPRFVDTHVQVHERSSGRIIVGPYPPASEVQNSFFNIGTRLWWSAKFCAMRQKTHRFTYQDMLGGNVSMAKSTFQRLGGFDPKMTEAHEDYELGVRAIESDIQISFEANAMARHYVHESTNIRGSMMRSRQEGQADVKIGVRHMNIRPSLPLVGFAVTPYLAVRIFRTLAMRLPRSGDLAVTFLAILLRPLEALRLRGTWYRLYGLIRDYWYWRGVRDELGGLVDLVNFLQHSPQNGGDVLDEIELDLKEGIQSVMHRVEETRPRAVRMRYGEHFVGRIPVVPGAEPLRGIHIVSALRDQFAAPLANAIARETPLSDNDQDILVRQLGL